MGTRGIDDIEPAARASIRELTGLDPVATLRYFDSFYLAPLSRFTDLRSASLLDCACGTGWLAMAARFRGLGQVVATDLYPVTLERAREVARVLGLDREIDFVEADVTKLPFADRQFDVVCTIETLEHVPVDRAAPELARVCDKYFVVETINRHFPIDTHDTPYPLVHFLPSALRRRANLHHGTTEMNRYPTWREVEGALTGFRRLTPFKTFQNPQHWESAFPYDNPYVSGLKVSLDQPKWRAKRAYYRANYALFGSRGRYALDKVMGIYQRPQAGPRA